MKHTLVTLRANGKAHPAIQFEVGGVMFCCSCPGSKNGTLGRNAVKVADGHEKANCRDKLPGGAA